MLRIDAPEKIMTRDQDNTVTPYCLIQVIKWVIKRYMRVIALTLYPILGQLDELQCRSLLVSLMSFL